MEKQTKTRKKLKIWMWVLLGVVAVLSAVVLRYAWMFYVDPMSAFNDQLETPTPGIATPTVEPATPSPTAEQTAAPTRTPLGTLPPTPTVPPTPEPTLTPELDLGFMKNRVNILILGWDESPERNVEGSDVYRDDENNFRSDVIMLLSVNFKTGRVDLISVPRDTLAQIYTSAGEKYSETAHFKINAAFAKGGSVKGDGFKWAMETVSRLFGGVPIQYYAGVNMEGLKAVVDAMGGVDYDVDVRIELNGRILEKGYQHLSGQQVLDYCRARKGISSDVGRTDRQQRMLFAIFGQLKSRDQLKNFLNIYNSVKGYIYTNLDADQIATMASFAMGLDMDDLHRKTLEGKYVDATSYSGASFYCLYNDKLAELADKVFGVTIRPDPKQDAEYVLADKAASAARKYVTGAAYLAGLVDGIYGGELTFMPAELRLDYGFMTETARELAALVAVRPNNDENLPYDRAAMEPLVEKLALYMGALCTDMGYTQASLDKAQLPEEFYKGLPKS
ncbi:MAG TPA: LCP family protein [Clostridia bacterium]|nr:LCP family protein [Clostridia bacterium]